MKLLAFLLTVAFVGLLFYIFGGAAKLGGPEDPREGGSSPDRRPQ